MLSSAGHGCWANCESGSCSLDRARFPGSLRVARPVPPWRLFPSRPARQWARVPKSLFTDSVNEKQFSRRKERYQAPVPPPGSSWPLVSFGQAAFATLPRTKQDLWQLREPHDRSVPFRWVAALRRRRAKANSAMHLRPLGDRRKGHADRWRLVSPLVPPSKKARRAPVHTEPSKIVSTAAGIGQSARPFGVRRDSRPVSGL